MRTSRDLPEVVEKDWFSGAQVSLDKAVRLEQKPFDCETAGDIFNLNIIAVIFMMLLENGCDDVYEKEQSTGDGEFHRFFSQ